MTTEFPDYCPPPQRTYAVGEDYVAAEMSVHERLTGERISVREAGRRAVASVTWRWRRTHEPLENAARRVRWMQTRNTHGNSVGQLPESLSDLRAAMGMR